MRVTQYGGWGRRQLWLLIVMLGELLFAEPSATALAQDCINDVNYTCENLQPSTCGGTGWPCLWPDPSNLKPDRRPVVKVNLLNASYQDDPWGRNGSWVRPEDEDPANGIPDGFDFLLARMEEYFNDGFRRIQLHMPAGSTACQSYASSQFWPMEQWMRDGLREFVVPWLESKLLEDPDNPVTLGVYSGFRITEPCTRCMRGDNTPGCMPNPECHEGLPRSRVPDFTNPVDVCTIAQNLLPWADMGFKEFHFDAASIATNRDALMIIAGRPEYAQLKIGGEAIPMSSGPAAGRLPLVDYSSRVRWHSAFKFMTLNPKLLTITHDPINTELGALLNSNNGGYVLNEGVVYDFTRRNWVMWAMSRGEYTRWIRRAYGRAWFPNVDVPCIGDLDGDWDTDQDDLSIILLQLEHRGSYVTRVHGDLDADFDVDWEDIQILLDNMGCQAIPSDEAPNEPHRATDEN